MGRKENDEHLFHSSIREEIDSHYQRGYSAGYQKGMQEGLEFLAKQHRLSINPIIVKVNTEGLEGQFTLEELSERLRSKNNGIRFKKGINFHEVLKNWKQDDTKYKMTSVMDEYIYIYKVDGVIEQKGYNGLIMEWVSRDYLEQY